MARLVKFAFLGVLLFFLQTTVFAQSANTMLNDLLKNIRSMQADFTQVIKDNKGKVIQKSKGVMALQRPGKFRWETKTPNTQLVVASETRLWIYDPGLEQVVVRALAKQTGQTPALLLSDANPVLETDFNVKSEKDSASSLQWFVLIPKDRGSMFTSIRMGFAGQELHEMQLRDHLDHVTTIQFSHIKFNNPLPTALFHFAPPKNVDVIDETKQQ
jgi:outer membrane lipoprotein carrier protein